MTFNIEEIRNKLINANLKITPQRIAILKAIYELNNHPTAEMIIESVRRENPNVASGTVYNVLDTFVENKIIKKVTTENGVMRYDGIIENHHHLYCTECDLIEDYKDEELDKLLINYFKDKNIEGFHKNEFIVQIKGTFDKC